MKPSVSVIPDPDLSTESRDVSAARRKRIIEKQNGICKRPFCEEVAVDVDHIIPLWRFGSNRDDNLEALCVACHAIKTKVEAKVRAKAKAQGGETGQWARRKKNGSRLKSGGFDKTLTKGMDGKVRPRASGASK